LKERKALGFRHEAETTLQHVCIDQRRTIIDQCPEKRGDRVYLYGQDAEVRFEVSEVAAL
jgi:hypothetical protein